MMIKVLSSKRKHAHHTAARGQKATNDCCGVQLQMQTCSGADLDVAAAPGEHRLPLIIMADRGISQNCVYSARAQSLVATVMTGIEYVS